MVRNYIRKTEERWSKEELLAALIELKDHKIRLNEATVKYGISRATLYRNLTRFIAGGATLDVEQFKTCGGNPILTKVEEAVLAKTINDLGGKGFDISPVDVKRICYEYCVANGIPNRFNEAKRVASDDWYYGFLKRHPGVAVTKKNRAVGPGRPRAQIEEAKSKMGPGSEVITKEKSKVNGKSPTAPGGRNVRRVPPPPRSRLNAKGGKEVRGSPKLIAPDGMEVAPKKINAAKRLKLDAEATGTGSIMVIRRSSRTRSLATVDEDIENEDKLVNAAVVQEEQEEGDQMEGVETETVTVTATNDIEEAE